MDDPAVESRVSDIDVARGDLQVVARVARLLRILAPGQRTIRLAQASAELGVGRSTAHRYLTSMETHGLLRRVDGANYELGPLLVQVGVLASTGSRVIEAAGPVLESLAHEVQQTTVLSVPGGAGLVVARTQEERSRVISVSVAVGSTLAWNSAQGRVYLAHLDDPRLQERLVQGLPAEPRASLLASLDATRTAGVVVYEFADAGVRTIAVPVFDGGAVCATLAVVGIASLVPEGADSEPATAVIAAGRALSDLVSGKTGEAAVWTRPLPPVTPPHNARLAVDRRPARPPQGEP